MNYSDKKNANGYVALHSENTFDANAVLSERIQKRIQSKLIEANKTLKELFVYFNTETGEQKAAPQWRFDTREQYYSCFLEPEEYAGQFAEEYKIFIGRNRQHSSRDELYHRQQSGKNRNLSQMKRNTFRSILSSLKSKTFRKKLLDHAASILFVMLIFLVLMAAGLDREKNDREKKHELIEMMTKLRNVDFNNPMQKSFFRETLDIYFPSEKVRNDSVMQSIEAYRTEQFTNKVYKTGGMPTGLSWQGIVNVSGMYLNFIFVYIIVLLVSYYATQTFALYSFIQYKQRKLSYLVRGMQQLCLIGEKIRNGNNPLKEAWRCVVFVSKALHQGRRVARTFRSCVYYRLFAQIHCCDRRMVVNDCARCRFKRIADQLRA